MKKAKIKFTFFGFNTFLLPFRSNGTVTTNVASTPDNN